MPLKTHHSRHTRPLLALAALACAAASAQAADETAVFESKIRPLLAEHCYECHSAEKKQKAGLALDSKAGWEKGGDSGAPIVPGKPEESLLIKAVRWADKDLRMPPEKAGGKLTDSQITDLETWIKGGAYDPRLNATAASRGRSNGRRSSRRAPAVGGACRPLRAGALPPEVGAESPADAVDAPLRARMKAEGVAAFAKSGCADSHPARLVVLTGLAAIARWRSEAFVSGGGTARTLGLTRRSSTGCSRRRNSANALPGIGWTWCGSPRPAATSGTTTWPTRGVIATTSFARSIEDVPYDQFVARTHSRRSARYAAYGPGQREQRIGHRHWRTIASGSVNHAMLRESWASSATTSRTTNSTR